MNACNYLTKVKTFINTKYKDLYQKITQKKIFKCNSSNEDSYTIYETTTTTSNINTNINAPKTKEMIIPDYNKIQHRNIEQHNNGFLII